MTTQEMAVFAAGLMLVGGILAVGARRRVALVTGALVAILPAPLLAQPDVGESRWVMAAAFFLIATLLAGFLLVVGPRDDPASRAARPTPVMLWIALLPAAFVAGAAAWPLLARATDVAVGAAATGAATLDPGRLAMGASWASVVAAVALLTTPDLRRLAVAAGLVAVAAVLAGAALDRRLVDVLLPATGILSMCAAASAAWLSPRMASD